MIVVKWYVKDYKGWCDLIPESWLEAEGSFEGLHHYCTKGKIYIDCLVNIEVRKKSLRLDYGGCSKRWNMDRDIDPGVIKIDFSGGDRKCVKSIWWAEDGITFEQAGAKWLPNSDYEVIEGRQELVSHLRRERDPWLVNAKKQHVIQHSGKLVCEACGFEFVSKYGELGREFCEVHHINPLKSGPRTVTIDDLAVLCSNCHRMIHRTSPIETIAKFKRRFA